MRVILYLICLCFISTSYANHIAALSEPFLGKPYLRNALGEGPNGYYDQRPLYRMDAFDCETLVDTVLALELVYPSKDISEAIKKVRYDNGRVTFLTRNHFTCKDWNPHNQAQGFISDITTKITDQHHKPIFKIAEAQIDTAQWIQRFDITHIYVNNASKTETQKRLIKLKQKSRHIPKALSTIAYIPLNILFNAQGQPNYYLFDQIPEGAIIEIIRPNWDVTEKIGTHLQVSHMGFAIWKKRTLYFREASSTEQKVVDAPLINYLSTALSSPTIKGINIQKVNLN